MYKKFFINFIKVDINEVGQRIDNFLIKKIKNLPKCKIYSLLRKGNIRINGKRVVYKYKLLLNDMIRLPLIKLNKQKKFHLSKNILNLFKKLIIYEDKYILVINKPYGMSVHGGKNIYYNIIDIYKYLFNNLYIELIHRLDRNTSGVLMLAKSRYALCTFHYFFVNKKIKKKYIALVYGLWPKNIKFVITEKKNSCIENKKYSKTLFKVKNYINNFTLLYIYPITGHKHQIRKHTSLKGYPIVFDHIYGNYKLNKYIYSLLKIKRMCLHAYYIHFVHPFTKIEQTFFAKKDKNFSFILKKIKYLNFNKII